MKRVDKVFQHPLYQNYFLALQEAEKDRIFCRHTIEHFMDVARLMYISDLEYGTLLDKDVIYATALLHDIGRVDQLRTGVPHDEASAVLAGQILPDCGFSESETEMIQYAIANHRNARLEHQEDSQVDEETERLAAYLYSADKRSRCCFSCNVKEECNWVPERKNMQIRG